VTIRTLPAAGNQPVIAIREAGKPSASIAVIADRAQLLPAYDSSAELEPACPLFCYQVNARPHPVTRRAPCRDAGRGGRSAASAARVSVHSGVRG
jgi:hypothetical protein